MAKLRWKFPEDCFFLFWGSGRSEGNGSNKKWWRASVPASLRKYVLSAFNDYFILTGEFISGLHYRSLAVPGGNLYASRFASGGRRRQRKGKTEKDKWERKGRKKSERSPVSNFVLLYIYLQDLSLSLKGSWIFHEYSSSLRLRIQWKSFKQPELFRQEKFIEVTFYEKLKNDLCFSKLYFIQLAIRNLTVQSDHWNMRKTYPGHQNKELKLLKLHSFRLKYCIMHEGADLFCNTCLVSAHIKVLWKLCYFNMHLENFRKLG